MAAVDRRADAGRFELHYLFAHPRENWFLQAVKRLPADHPTITSLGTFHHPASLFEREIHDLFGIVALDHPDPRPLVRHGFWPEDYFPLRKDAGPRDFRDDGRPFPFTEVGGEGVYEIPVGPVHAGVIEPGHFRFSVVGETIIDMKVRLYWTHKGTEKLFEGRTPAEGLRLAERVSGDTSVGHALAFCQALESAARDDGARPGSLPARRPAGAGAPLQPRRRLRHDRQRHRLRGGPLALLPDPRASPAAEQARHGPPAPARGCDPWRCRQGPAARSRSRGGGRRPLLRDFDEIVDLTLRNTLVMDRLEGTGRLTTRTARDHGVLGYVARASGIDADVRRDHPFAAYGALRFQVPVHETGDVKARTLVRVEEARESVGLIRQAVAGLPAGPLDAALPPLPPWEPAFGIVEGWRGAILHWVMADEAGRLASGQDRRPVLPELAAALLRAAQEHRARFPAVQQVVQPVVLG